MKLSFVRSRIVVEENPLMKWKFLIDRSRPCRTNRTWITRPYPDPQRPSTFFSSKHRSLSKRSDVTQCQSDLPYRCYIKREGKGYYLVFHGNGRIIVLTLRILTSNTIIPRSPKEHVWVGTISIYHEKIIFWWKTGEQWVQKIIWYWKKQGCNLE